MELNNGLKATSLGEDDFGREVYRVVINKRPVKLVMVDNKLHTMTDDGEPIAPVKNEYQLKKG